MKTKKVFFTWLLSFLLIYSIPSTAGLFMQANVLKNWGEQLHQMGNQSAVQLREQCDDRLEQVTQSVSYIRDNADVLLLLKDETDLATRKLNEQRAFQYLQSEIILHEPMRNVFIFSYKQGQPILSTVYGSNTQDLSLFSYSKYFGMEQNEFFQKIRNSTMTIMAFQNSSGQYKLYDYSPIITDDLRNPAGFLLAEFDLRDQDPVSEQTNITGILIDPDLRWDIQNRSILPDEINFQGSESESGAEISIDHTRYLMSRENSRLGRYQYILAISTAELYARLHFAQLVYFGVMVISFVTSLWIAHFLSKKNYHPLLRLIENIQNERFEEDIKGNEVFQFLGRSYQNLMVRNRKLETRLENESWVIRNHVLGQLLKGYYETDARLDEALALNQIQFSGASFRVCLWSVDEFVPDENQNALLGLGKGTTGIYFLIESMCSEYLKTENMKIFAVECDGMLALILNDAYTKKRPNIDEWLYQQLRNVESILEKQTAMKLSWFISDTYSKVSELQYAYTDCLGKLAQWNTTISAGAYQQKNLDERETKLLLLLEEQDYAGAAKLFADIGSEYKSENEWERRLFLYSLIQRIKNVLDRQEAAVDTSEIHLFLNMEQTEKLIENVEKWIYRIGRAEPSSDRSEQIFEFVHQNLYNSELSLKLVADYFKVTESTVSKAVKKECGINLSNYVREQRVERVKQLIRDTSIGLNEIAGAAGFNS